MNANFQKDGWVVVVTVWPKVMKKYQFKLYYVRRTSYMLEEVTQLYIYQDLINLQMSSYVYRKTNPHPFLVFKA